MTFLSTIILFLQSSRDIQKYVLNNIVMLCFSSLVTNGRNGIVNNGRNRHAGSDEMEEIVWK